MARSPADPTVHGAWRPGDMLPTLQAAPFAEVEGYLANASNATVLARLAASDGPVRVVYKPRAGERPLWDFPVGSLHRREVAAYEVSAALGWGLVPPTVLREGPLGAGSVQLFVPHDPRRHYFVLVGETRHHEALARMALFDLLVNNADRKASHVLHGPDGALYAIDHGVTFAVEPKLRTVVWDLDDHPLLPPWRGDLRRLAAGLATGDAPLATTLERLLAKNEIDALRRRALALAVSERLPTVPEDGRPYPWPPL